MPLRFVAMGDSYTVGTAVAPADAFPTQLVARLAAATDGPAPLELVANLGVNGWTSAGLIRDQLPVLGELDPGFVSVLVGANDVVQEVPAATYAANVETILDACLGRMPADRIVTVTIPDYTVTPGGGDYGDPVERSAGIRAHNATMARLATARGIACVDIHDISLAAATDPTLVADDDLHPSGAQYARWVDRIAPVVTRLLGGVTG